MKIKVPELFATLKEFLNTYLTVIKKRSENTISSYKDTIRLYLEYLQLSQNKPLASLIKSDFSQNNIIGFMDWLKSDRSNLPSTINQRLSHIRVLCSYLMKNNFITYGELNDINEIALIPDKRVKKLIWLTIDELKLILTQPDLDKKTGIRDKFFIVLLYESGCRNQELLNLRIVDFETTKKGEATLHILGKGKKYRVIPIAKETVDLYYEYCKKYHSIDIINPNDLLFYTVRNEIKTKMSADNVQRFLRHYEQLARKLNITIPHLHPHLMRTTRAMHLYLAGVPLPLIADWLGHSQLDTTRIYAAATIEMKRTAVKNMELNINDEYKDEVAFKYTDDEEVILKLCGLK
jgi:site-specific recombinase XerD